MALHKMAPLKLLTSAAAKYCRVCWDGGAGSRLQMGPITSVRFCCMSVSPATSTDGPQQVTGSAFGLSLESNLNLSFCGCGFLGLYHLGVATKFAQCGRRFLSQVDRYAGASAGSLVACLLGIMGPDVRIIDKCCVFSYDLAQKTEETWFGVLSPRSNLLQPLEVFLYDLLPNDAHQVATGRLFLSLTNKQSSRNVIVSDFDSNDHLVQCLLASCCLPYLTTGPNAIKINGERHLDGGLTNNLPILTKGRTVTVSPFCGRHDVSPQDLDSWCGIHVNVLRQDFRVNVNNVIRAVHTLVPPNTAQLRTYFKRGANDAERFLKREQFFEDDMHLHPGHTQSL